MRRPRSAGCLTDVDAAHRPPLRADQVLEPEDVVESERDGGDEPVEGHLHVQVEVVSQQDAAERAHAARVAEVDAHAAALVRQRVLGEVGVLGAQLLEVGRPRAVDVTRVHELVERHRARDAAASERRRGAVTRTSCKRNAIYSVTTRQVSPGMDRRRSVVKTLFWEITTQILHLKNKVVTEPIASGHLSSLFQSRVSFRVRFRVSFTVSLRV